MKLTRTIKTGLLFGAWICIPSIAYAQSNYLPDFKEAESLFSTVQSSNAAFLKEYPWHKVSYFQTHARKSNGKFIDYSQSDDAYRVGLRTESYFRFNEKIMLYGMMSYDMDEGKNMSGSAFIYPSANPFDIVEMTDSCAGKKKFEAYALRGALSYELTDQLALGANVFYQTSNYAKHKDLRHQNSRMDLTLDVGVSYRPISWMTLGMSYTYKRQNESIGFDVYGNTDKQYYSLINYGGFFGRKEAFGESGYTSETTPLFTETHGAALQALVKFNNGLQWFNQFHYHKADGRFGSGDDRKVIYSTHGGDEWGYTGKLIAQNDARAHVLELKIDNMAIDNFENSYRESTDANGVSQIKYYGKNKMQDHVQLKGAFSYTFHKKMNKARPQYSAGVRAMFDLTDAETIYYPFYRKQKINQWQADLFGVYHWFKQKNVFTLSLWAGYGAGGGTMKEDGTYAAVPDDQKRPASRDDLLLRQYDYLTASRIHGRLALGYERNILKNIAAYVNGSVSPRYALNSSLKEKTYVCFDVSLGVKF